MLYICEIREGHCSDNGVLFIACIIKSAKVLTVKMFGVVSYCRVQEKGFLETTCTFVYLYPKVTGFPTFHPNCCNCLLASSSFCTHKNGTALMGEKVFTHVPGYQKSWYKVKKVLD